MTIAFQIQDLDGNDITGRFFGQVMPGTTVLQSVLIANVGDETPSDCRLTCSTLDGEWTGGTNLRGQELVTEKWLQAKIGAGAWTPIGGIFTTLGNYLSVTPPAPAASVEVELRLVVPTDASTGGDTGFTLEAAVTP